MYNESDSESDSDSESGAAPRRRLGVCRDCGNFKLKFRVKFGNFGSESTDSVILDSESARDSEGALSMGVQV
jgi:hypothetical protein